MWRFYRNINNDKQYIKTNWNLFDVGWSNKYYPFSKCNTIRDCCKSNKNNNRFMDGVQIILKGVKK